MFTEDSLLMMSAMVLPNMSPISPTSPSKRTCRRRVPLPLVKEEKGNGDAKEGTERDRVQEGVLPGPAKVTREGIQRATPHVYKKDEDHVCVQSRVG